MEGPAIPSVKPVYHWFLTDDRGYLWVDPELPAEADGHELEVFDPDGRYLGRIHTDFPRDASLVPVIRGERLYTVVSDDLGVQFLVSVPIIGRQGVP